ncbi:olfactory receptor 13A1-like [Apodemus sylvaticus]|uniref:olfactory receptor 13A1-like n=1 Tax=Apodemus sylvaticus TaxID=10129 RepID=UPI002242364B|nr:olfactory receptor 13A1-like [Apodemus sylvaticus]
MTSRPNQTEVTEFVLQGFSEHPSLRLFLTGCFLSLYTMALMGNILIIALVTFSAGLHNPMYFFLCNLATMDIICTSSVLPKALVGLLLEESTISFKGRMAQLFFLVWSLCSELLLLTVMAYDCSVDICFLLHYSSRMRPQLCGALSMEVWSICALNASVNTGLMTQLSFCGPKVITPFFCEIPPLLLSCSPTYVNSIITLMADVFYGGINFMLTLLSYGYIIVSILRMGSAEGKRKAFSTCSSHVIVVSVYYSSVFCAYVSPASSYSPERSKSTTLLYSLLNTTLKPLIYTLRKKDVKLALGMLLPSFSH